MTKQRVKELTSDGIKLAREFLRNARDGKATELPNGLLIDTAYARDISASCFVEKRTFTNRRDAGQYLSQALEPLGIGAINGNYQLWSWLGMFYFDCLIDQDEKGKFKLGKTRPPDRAFIFDEDKMNLQNRDMSYNRLKLAWEVLQLYGEDYGWWILNQPVISVDSLVDEIVQSHSRSYAKEIVKLIGLLYIDPQTGQRKAGSIDKEGQGSIRRLSNFINQLYVTYDVYRMRAEELLAILPEEFKHFNAAAGSARKR